MDINSEKEEEYILGTKLRIHKYEIKRIKYRKNRKYKKFSCITLQTFIFFVFILLLMLFLILLVENNLILKNNKKKQNGIKALNNEIKEDVKSNITNDWEKEKLIIHALGRFNNFIYTNSLDAINYWYFQKKMHFIEADCLLTSDNHVVLSHDFSHLKKTPTLSEFKQSYAKGKLMPMTFEDLVLFMEKHPDLFIITDTKYDDIPNIKIEFDEMTEILSHHKNVSERFIIEVYNEKMFLFLNERKYPFKFFMFTLYKRWNGKNYEDLENIFSFCVKYKLKGIIMYKSLFNNQIYNLSNKYSIPIYLHTENSIIKVAEFLKKVKGVFTDELDKYVLEEYLSNQTKILL